MVVTPAADEAPDMQTLFGENPPLDDSAIAQSYRDAATSPLRATVEGGKRNEFSFELRVDGNE